MNESEQKVDPKPPKKSQKMPKKGLLHWIWLPFRLFLKTTIILLLTVTLLLFFILAFVDQYLDDQTLKELMISQVEKQTGGKLELGDLKFSLLKGLRLRNVAMYSPALGDTRGYVNGGAIEDEPFFQAADFEVAYHFAEILSGRFHLDALQLRAVKLWMHQKPEGSPIDAILAYRTLHFPSEPSTTDPAPEPPQVGPPYPT